MMPTVDMPYTTPRKMKTVSMPDWVKGEIGGTTNPATMIAIVTKLLT